MPLAVQIENLSFNYKTSLYWWKIFIFHWWRAGMVSWPNGAGKTTLMNLMAGLLSYKEGSIKIFEKKFRRIKKKLTDNRYVPRDFAFGEELSPAEKYGILAPGMERKWKDQTKTKELLRLPGLSEVPTSLPSKQFSGGMKRKSLNDTWKILFGWTHSGSGCTIPKCNYYFPERNQSAGTTLIYTSHQLMRPRIYASKLHS